MGFHIGGIDRGGERKHAFGDQGIEDVSPYPAPGPAVEAIVDGGRRAVPGGAVLPAAAGLQHMQNTADHPAVIHPPRARLVLRQMRLDRRPCIIA